MMGAAIKRLHYWLVPEESGEDWTVYLWLVYLLFFSLEWWFRPVSMLELGLAALTLVAFLVLYFSTWRVRGRRALLQLSLIAALGLVWTPFNAGASVFMIYASAFACRVGPPRQALIVVVAIAALVSVVAWGWQPLFQYWVPGALISLIIGVANIWQTERERQNAELRLSQAEVRRLARIAERERIARDLHDLLGHTLSLITVKSELAGRLIERDPVRARDEIAEVEATARKALSEVRSAISGMHEQNLDEALAHAELSLRSADVVTEIERAADCEPPPRVGAMLALVLREAVTNILRHAQARHCRITLSCASGQVGLDIVDDGRGGIRAEGNGVVGMRARVESLGGSLTLGPAPGGHLSIRVPLQGAES
jgi:two-component system sensor histidine kinase DesK